MQIVNLGKTSRPTDSLFTLKEKVLSFDLDISASDLLRSQKYVIALLVLQKDGAQRLMRVEINLNLYDKLLSFKKHQTQIYGSVNIKEAKFLSNSFTNIKVSPQFVVIKSDQDFRLLNIELKTIKVFDGQETDALSLFQHSNQALIGYRTPEGSYQMQEIIQQKDQFEYWSHADIISGLQSKNLTINEFMANQFIGIFDKNTGIFKQ